MKFMVGLVIAILIIFSLKLFWPVSDDPVSPAKTEEVLQEKVSISTPDEGQTAVEAVPEADEGDKADEMTAEYALLEKARKQLKRHLGRLKHEMWGLKFPPEEAKKISEIMLNGHKLLKNPDMLGAFHNVQGIQAEITKIEFIEKSLDEIDSMIIENKKNKKD